MRHVEER